MWIAAAFLDTLGLAGLASRRWSALVLADRNADVTWGGGPDQAVTTAAQVASLVFLGVPIEDAGTAGAFLRRSQLVDGAWLDGDSQSSVRACYQVLRGLRALAVDVADPQALTSFVAACRCSDGSYTTTPTQAAGSLLGTYLALSVDRWVHNPHRPGIN